MLQQSVDASGHVNTGLAAVQKELDSKLSDQQTKLVAPLATLGAKIDQMADDFRSAEREAANVGLEVVGWYHSHPDHPARPSEFDREHAWPWYSYVIVSVAAGQPEDMTSWLLADDRTHFLPEEISGRMSV